MKKSLFCLFLGLILLLGGNLYAQPQPPVLQTPPNGATGVGLFPTFDWTDVAGATSYRIQVFQGVNTVLDQGGLTSSQYAVVSGILQYTTEYWWRVNATGSTGTSNWSLSFTFTTQVQPPAVPVLVAPPNNSINVPLTPNLDWEDVPSAQSYRVQVSTSSSFTTTVLNVGGLTNSGYIVPPGILQNGQIYYWHVNATNQGGTSAYSATWNFTTIPLPPPPPIPLSPPNNAVNVSTTPTLDWSDVSAATSYHVQVSSNPQFTGMVVDVTGINVSQYAIGPGILSGTTQYWWRVSSANAGGEGIWSAVFHFTTIVGAPAAPLLLTPPNNSVNVALNPTLDWGPVAGATSYRVQVSIDPNFVTTVLNVVTGSSSQYTIGPGLLQNNTLYYWRANATNAGGTSPWSSVWNFTTVVGVPAAPTLISPPNGATNVSITPLFDWSDVATATSYRLQISTNPSFTNVVFNQIGIDSSQFSLPSGVLIGNTQYYWRVLAANAGGSGPWATAFNFTTQQSFFLNLKVYLEGFYKSSTQMQVRDTVKVYLANATSPYLLRDSSSAYLDSAGNALISFVKAPNGSYYIIIKHRNHLETWSISAQSFSTGFTTVYNFTNSSGKAYGNNMKQVGSVWTLYGGDANVDGYVDPTDYNLFVTQFGLDGYKSGDFNGDNFVDGYDLPILYGNFGKSLARPY